jgi:hypothetical protein
MAAQEMRFLWRWNVDTISAIVDVIWGISDKAPGRDEYAWETTIAAERAGNLHIRDGIEEAAFVKMRTERDAKLDMPALVLPSIQVNMRAGELPPPEENGVSYLKLPVNVL